MLWSHQVVVMRGFNTQVRVEQIIDSLPLTVAVFMDMLVERC